MIQNQISPIRWAALVYLLKSTIFMNMDIKIPNKIVAKGIQSPSQPSRIYIRNVRMV